MNQGRIVRKQITDFIEKRLNAAREMSVFQEANALIHNEVVRISDGEIQVRVTEDGNPPRYFLIRVSEQV